MCVHSEIKQDVTCLVVCASSPHLHPDTWSGAFALCPRFMSQRIEPLLNTSCLSKPVITLFHHRSGKCAVSICGHFCRGDRERTRMISVLFLVHAQCICWFFRFFVVSPPPKLNRTCVAPKLWAGGICFALQEVRADDANWVSGRDR